MKFSLVNLCTIPGDGEKSARMGITGFTLVMTDDAFDPQDAPPHPSHQQDEI